MACTVTLENKILVKEVLIPSYCSDVCFSSANPQVSPYPALIPSSLLTSSGYSIVGSFRKRTSLSLQADRNLHQ
jgi:hypothetical protein